jgi:hypothetical protein
LCCRVFLYKEGLVRFCTTPYKRPTSNNLACNFMHLTNYAVNKHNTAAFVAPKAAAAAAGAQPAAEGAAAAAAAAAAGAQPAAEGAAAAGAAVGVVSKARGSSNDGKEPADSNDWQQQQQQQPCASEAKGDASKWSFQQLKQHLECQGRPTTHPYRDQADKWPPALVLKKTSELSIVGCTEDPS